MKVILLILLLGYRGTFLALPCGPLLGLKVSLFLSNKGLNETLLTLSFLYVSFVYSLYDGRSDIYVADTKPPRQRFYSTPDHRIFRLLTSFGYERHCPFVRVVHQVGLIND